MSKFFTTDIASALPEYEGLKFLTIKSNALKRRADITVFDSDPSREKTLSNVPLVILLHGVYGSHWAWLLKGYAHRTLKNMVNKNQVRPMILAMPSDGHFADGSGYLPHRTENYESWIVEDVIEAIKENFPAIGTESPIFIAGLSMGGFGALRMGAKYPGRFKAFSGLSAITHFDQMKLFVQDFDQLKSVAMEQDGVLDWMLRNRSHLSPFRFDCGREDILIDHNRTLHQKLKAENIPHSYQEFNGGHTWDYWKDHINETFLFFEENI